MNAAVHQLSHKVIQEQKETCKNDTKKQRLTNKYVFEFVMTLLPPTAESLIEWSVVHELLNRYSAFNPKTLCVKNTKFVANFPLNVLNEALKHAGFELVPQDEEVPRGNTYGTLLHIVANCMVSPLIEGSSSKEIPHLVHVSDEKLLSDVHDDNFAHLVATIDGSSDFRDSHCTLPLKKSCTLGYDMATGQQISRCYIKKIISGYWILEHKGALYRDKVMTILSGRQISPNNIESPLLVPNEITREDTTKKIDISDKAKARKEYRDMLSQSPTRHKTNRLYLNGVKYNNIESYIESDDGPYVLTPRVGETTKILVSVENRNNESVCESVIVVRKTDNTELLDSVVRLGDALNISSRMPVVRNTVKDGGKMIGLGLHSHNREDVVFKSHSHLEDASLAATASKKFREELETHFPANLLDIKHCFPGNICDEIGGALGVSHNAMFSINLANAPHEDPNDLTNSVAVWASNDENGLKNWYFVFPDIMIYANGRWYKGLMVKLSNGVEMEWDGRILRHCTSKTDREGDANAYSFFTGGNGKLSKIRLTKMMNRL